MSVHIGNISGEGETARQQCQQQDNTDPARAEHSRLRILRWQKLNPIKMPIHQR